MVNFSLDAKDPVVLYKTAWECVEDTWDFELNQLCDVTAKKAGKVLGYSHWIVVYPLDWGAQAALVRLHPGDRIQFWEPYFKKHWHITLCPEKSEQDIVECETVLPQVMSWKRWRHLTWEREDGVGGREE